MMHAYHENLPGYDEAQILHDGCDQCEQRGTSRNLGIAYLDRIRFARAWHRAAQWNQGQLDDRTLSKAELPMLDALWAVQCQLENYGNPIGQVPHGDRG
jgi:hypothetical protein